LLKLAVKNEAVVISRRYKTWLGAVVLLVAVCLILFTVFSTNRLGQSGATLLVDRVSSLVLPPRLVSNLTLIDSDERPFTAHNLVDRWTFIVFGFTYCPDVCPSTLAVLTEFREALTREFAEAKDVNIILVTVDPERDTLILLGCRGRMRISETWLTNWVRPMRLRSGMHRKATRFLIRHHSI
jgi:protein SCO1/2